MVIVTKEMFAVMTVPQKRQLIRELTVTPYELPHTAVEGAGMLEIARMIGLPKGLNFSNGRFYYLIDYGGLILPRQVTDNDL